MNEGLQRSVDPTCASTKENPVKIGPLGRVRLDVVYLNALRGPNGKPVEYERQGACCMFETKDPESGGSMPSIDSLSVAGDPKEFFMVVNLYDPGPPWVPAGLLQRNWVLSNSGCD